MHLASNCSNSYLIYLKLSKYLLIHILTMREDIVREVLISVKRYCRPEPVVKINNK